MKKFYVQLVLLCCFSIAMQAQSKTGTFGLQVEAGYNFELSESYSFNLSGNSHADFNHQAWNIAVSPGYHVTDKLFAGVGVAFYDYDYSRVMNNIYGGDESKQIEVNSNFMSAPIYAHGTWKFRAGNRPSMFVSLKAGYGIILKNDYSKKGVISADYSGGLYVSPSVGYMYPINDKHAISLSVSYDVQKYTAAVKADDGNFDHDRTNSTFGVKVGWAF